MRQVKKQRKILAVAGCGDFFLPEKHSRRQVLLQQQPINSLHDFQPAQRPRATRLPQHLRGLAALARMLL
jgi:hypothetical protein